MRSGSIGFEGDVSVHADTVAINLALDLAVSQAAREMLSCGPDLDEETAVKACAQLGLLAKLRSGKQPDYGDRVTPPLYSTWFQLGHVNLAVCVANKMVEHSMRTTPNANAIGVFDFGSGTFALPIAFEVLRVLGKLHSDVTIVSIEKSREMDYCGGRIWQLFREQTQSINLGSSFSVRVVYQLDPSFDGAKCFSMMHAAYPSIKDALKRHVDEVAPSYGIATINANRQSRAKLDKLEQDCLREFIPKKIELGGIRLEHGMPMTMAYREWLWKRINTLTADRARSIQWLMQQEIPLWPKWIEAREYEDFLW